MTPQRINPIKVELQQALSAITRSEKDSYLPHKLTCITQAIEHISKANMMLKRVASFP